MPRTPTMVGTTIGSPMRRISSDRPKNRCRRASARATGMASATLSTADRTACHTVKRSTPSTYRSVSRAGRSTRPATDSTPASAPPITASRTSPAASPGSRLRATSAAHRPQPFVDPAAAVLMHLLGRVEQRLRRLDQAVEGVRKPVLGFDRRVHPVGRRHDALDRVRPQERQEPLRKLGLVTRSEEHTSELQSLMRISYDVFCLNNKNANHINTH